MPQHRPSAQQPAATICVTCAGAAANAAVEDIATPTAASLSIFSILPLSNGPLRDNARTSAVGSSAKHGAGFPDAMGSKLLDLRIKTGAPRAATAQGGGPGGPAWGRRDERRLMRRSIHSLGPPDTAFHLALSAAYHGGGRRPAR